MFYKLQITSINMYHTIVVVLIMEYNLLKGSSDLCLRKANKNLPVRESSYNLGTHRIPPISETLKSGITTHVASYLKCYIPCTNSLIMR